MADRLQITVLGSGTSVGVPTIGCHCAVCSSDDPRDKRLRPSILIRYGGKTVVVDTTPDFRQQALRNGIEALDAVLFTHAHADHVMGLDDIRPFNFRRPEPIPLYGAPETLAAIRRCFQYAFQDGPSPGPIPKIVTHEINGEPFDLFGLTVEPVRVLHGKEPVYGFRFGGRAAYFTDHSEIPPEAMERLKGLDVLFLDALRHRPHATHSTVARSLETAARLTPRRTYFTHICHDLPHEATEAALPPGIRLAYDGLELEVDLPAAG
jgi:phosphoribosyl 1,2-cyclic phosphate phosphodiesterase